MLILLVALALLQSVSLAERHRQWLEAEVHFLISDRETASFLAVASDDGRDRFIAEFWSRRDPTSGTSRNEFRDRHAARLEESDRLFTLMETQPGRFSERGRAYQLLGPPQSRQDFFYAGDRLFPLELWHYAGRTEAFLPESFYLIYFRQGGQGDYRLWNPVSDGVQALVPHPEPGRFLLDEGEAYQELRRVDIELAGAARSLVPGDDDARFSAQSLVANIEGYAEMAARYRGLEEHVRASTSFQQLGLAATAEVLYDATGIPQVHYALEVPFSKVQWREEGNRALASFGITCRMTEGRGGEVDAIEDWVDLDLSEAEKDSQRGQALSFQGRLLLPTGRYVLDFTLVSTPAGTRDTASLTVDVPDSADEAAELAPALSPILLARSREELGGGQFVDRLPFQVDGFVLNPTPDAVFNATEALAYVQLAGVPEGTTVHWSLRTGKDGDIVWAGKSEVSSAAAALTRAGGVLRTVPLENIPDGDYTLRIELPGLPSLARETLLTVDRSAKPPSVRVLSRESLAAGDGRIRLRRGLLFARIGDGENAIYELAAASRLRPRDLEVRLRLALLLYGAGRYAEAIATLQPVAPHFTNEPDALVLLGFAYIGLGEAEKAVSFLERALALRPDDGRLGDALAHAREQSVSQVPQ